MTDSPRECNEEKRPARANFGDAVPPKNRRPLRSGRRDREPPLMGLQLDIPRGKPSAVSLDCNEGRKREPGLLRDIPGRYPPRRAMLVGPMPHERPRTAPQSVRLKSCVFDSALTSAVKPDLF